MPITKSEKIWMDGRLVDWDDANIHILTHTLHYGCGVFEGIRAYSTPTGPAVFRQLQGPVIDGRTKGDTAAAVVAQTRFLNFLDQIEKSLHVPSLTPHGPWRT